MSRFTDWKEAHTEAVKLANLCQHDVAIRSVKEYGKRGFNVSLASRNDSDYAMAEMVRPGDPQ